MKAPEVEQDKNTINCRNCGQLWSCEFLEREVGMLETVMRIDKGEKFYDFIEKKGFIAAVPLDRKLEEVAVGELIIINCPGCLETCNADSDGEECVFCSPSPENNHYRIFHHFERKMQ